MHVAPTLLLTPEARAPLGTRARPRAVPRPAPAARPPRPELAALPAASCRHRFLGDLDGNRLLPPRTPRGPRVGPARLLCTPPRPPASLPVLPTPPERAPPRPLGPLASLPSADLRPRGKLTGCAGGITTGDGWWGASFLKVRAATGGTRSLLPSRRPGRGGAQAGLLVRPGALVPPCSPPARIPGALMTRTQTQSPAPLLGVAGFVQRSKSQEPRQLYLAVPSGPLLPPPRAPPAPRRGEGRGATPRLRSLLLTAPLPLPPPQCAHLPRSVPMMTLGLSCSGRKGWGEERGG